MIVSIYAFDGLRWSAELAIVIDAFVFTFRWIGSTWPAHCVGFLRLSDSFIGHPYPNYSWCTGSVHQFSFVWFCCCSNLWFMFCLRIYCIYLDYMEDFRILEMHKYYSTIFVFWINHVLHFLFQVYNTFLIYMVYHFVTMYLIYKFCSYGMFLL